MRNTKEIENTLHKEFLELSGKKLKCDKEKTRACKKYEKFIKTLSDKQLKLFNDYVNAQTSYQTEYAHEYGKYVIDFYRMMTIELIGKDI